MKTFSSPFSLISILVISMLSTCASNPAYAGTDVTVRNTGGFFAKNKVDSKYYPAQLCFSTDGNQTLIPCGKVPGGPGITPARLNAATTSITNAAYTQLLASTSDAATWISVYNGTSSELILATGTSGAPVQVMELPPSLTTAENLYIPAGTRLSAIAAVTTASSGVVMINLVQ